MAETRLYNNLLALPLFLGMSRSDLQHAAGQTKFDFKKYEEGCTIVNEGDICRHLYFLLSGSINVQTFSDDHAYTIEEDIIAPDIFQPEHIFGLSQRFTHTYISHEECSLMRIDKKEVMNLSDKFEIFRLNLLNLISTKTQKTNRKFLRIPPCNLEERIVRFFENHCTHPAGKKVFHIKMTRLAEELNDSRLDISRALNNLQKQDLIYLQRGRIIIPALEKLLIH